MGLNEIFTLPCRGRPTGIFDMKVQMGGRLNKKKELPTEHLHLHVITAHAHLSKKKKGFAL